MNKPVFLNSVCALVKWSYKRDSKAFRDWFDGIYEIYKDSPGFLMKKRNTSCMRKKNASGVMTNDSK